MTDLRRTVDEIRSLLQEEVIPLTDHLQQCADEYAEGCHDVNLRLRQCDEFLNQGLRSEALHFAELDPKLLDQVELLSFSESSAWAEVVSMYTLERAEPVLVSVVAKLKEAFAIQEPMQRLLDQHRLYALARCPLIQRLRVLRALADADPNSTHWETDVRDMERARIREIEVESRKAGADGDVDRLKSLVVELNSVEWREQIPPSLLKDLKQRGGHVARSQAREQLELLAVALHGAQASMDIVLARMMRESWNENAKLAQLSEQDMLLEQVGPILAWIEDEDRKAIAEQQYHQAVQDLERGLENESLDSTELMRLRGVVEKCGRGMPQLLGMKYRNRLSNITIGETRRNRLRIGGSVAGIVAVVAVIGFSVYYGMAAEKTRRFLATVDSLIDEQRLGEAEQLLDGNGAVSNSERALKVKRKLADAMQAERDRTLQFEAALQKVRSAKAAAEIEVALKNARELARTSEEKVSIGKLEEEWIERRDAVLAENERQFQEHASAATAKLLSLDRLLTVTGSDPEVRQLSDELTGELASLRVLQSEVAPESASQIDLLDSRFAAFRKAHAEVKKKEQLLMKLAQSALILPTMGETESKVKDYREQLTQFTLAFPDDSRTNGFRTAGNADLIRAVFSRQERFETWKRFWPANSSEVATRRRDCDQLLVDFPSNPDRELIARYQSFLKSLEWREIGDENSDQAVKSRLRALFSGVLIKEGHLLRTKTGTCYYLEKEKDLTGSFKVNFRYLSGFNGETEAVKDLEVDTLVSPKTTAPPQSVIANRVWESVSTVALEDWDTYMQDLVISLEEAKEIDPFLRYFLLLQTLEFAARGNFFLGAELESCLNELHDPDMDLSVSWMDPVDPATKSSRQLASNLLKRATGVEAIWKRAAAAQQKLESDLLQKSWPVGWLERDSGQKWILRSNWTDERKHELFCASPPAENGTRHWINVGSFQAGGGNLKIPANSELLEGTIVFATIPPSEAKTGANR
jgi:hypothetical protein